jgi:hypothetical protein
MGDRKKRVSVLVVRAIVRATAQPFGPSKTTI